MSPIERLIRGVLTNSIGAEPNYENYSIDIEYKKYGVDYPIKRNGTLIANLIRNVAEEYILVEYYEEIKDEEIKMINEALENILKNTLLNYTILH